MTTVWHPHCFLRITCKVGGDIVMATSLPPPPPPLVNFLSPFLSAAPPISVSLILSTTMSAITLDHIPLDRPSHESPSRMGSERRAYWAFALDHILLDQPSQADPAGWVCRQRGWFLWPLMVSWIISCYMESHGITWNRRQWD